jgi:hypothetical protein
MTVQTQIDSAVVLGYPESKPMSMFQPGQVWTYRTRPGEENSRLVVCQVDWDIHFGFTVHVAIDGVAIKSRFERSGLMDSVPHMPFAEEALKNSVVQMVASSAPLPAYQERYRSWKRAFDDGEAMGWTVTVAECLDGLERALASA